MSDPKTILLTALCPILLEDGRSLAELQAAEVPDGEARDLLARGFAEVGDARAESRDGAEETAPAAPVPPVPPPGGTKPPKPAKEGAPT